VQNAIDGISGSDLRQQVAAPERAGRPLLAASGARWGEVVSFLTGGAQMG
jgi:hypothetical protein